MSFSHSRMNVENSEHVTKSCVLGRRLFSAGFQGKNRVKEKHEK